MVRAFEEKLLYQEPDAILRFEDNAEQAIAWLEQEINRRET